MKWLAFTLSVSVFGSAAWAPAASASTPQNQQAASFFAQGNTFRDHGQLTEALGAYRQAVKAGSSEAAFDAGKILCDDASTSHGRERVLNLAEGVADLFQAATNHLPQACAELSDVLQKGVGVNTNFIAAYAWLELAAEKDHSYAAQLDQLVVQMSPDEIQQAQDLARQYARGLWPVDLVRPVDAGDRRLEVKGITLGGREKMVILNRVTFTEGDTLEVTPEKSPQSPATPTLTVTCKEIGPDYVLVSVAGETHLKLLSSVSLLD
jgi:hypothetical protein